MKNKKGMAAWIWILIILILIGGGIGIYFWLTKGSFGGSPAIGSSIPSPPALPN